MSKLSDKVEVSLAADELFCMVHGELVSKAIYIMWTTRGATLDTDSVNDFLVATGYWGHKLSFDSKVRNKTIELEVRVPVVDSSSRLETAFHLYHLHVGAGRSVQEVFHPASLSSSAKMMLVQNLDHTHSFRAGLVLVEARVRIPGVSFEELRSMGAALSIRVEVSRTAKLGGFRSIVPGRMFYKTTPVSLEGNSFIRGQDLGRKSQAAPPGIIQFPDEGYPLIGPHFIDSKCVLYWFTPKGPVAAVRMRNLEDPDNRIVIPAFNVFNQNFRSGPVVTDKADFWYSHGTVVEFGYDEDHGYWCLHRGSDKVFFNGENQKIWDGQPTYASWSTPAILYSRVHPSFEENGVHLRDPPWNEVRGVSTEERGVGMDVTDS